VRNPNAGGPQAKKQKTVAAVDGGPCKHYFPVTIYLTLFLWASDGMRLNILSW